MTYYVNVQDGVIAYISPSPTGLENEIELSADELLEITGFIPMFSQTVGVRHSNYLKEAIDQI